jgi:hypothetical protein
MAPDTAADPEPREAALRKARMVATAIQVVATAITFMVLKRTPDERLRGPRWLWQLIVPMTMTKVTSGVVIIAPAGPVLFFLFGRRRKK